MSRADADIHDFAPTILVRQTETFWATAAGQLDRDSAGIEFGAYRGENLLRVAPFIGTMLGLEADETERAMARGRVHGRPGLRIDTFDGVPVCVEGESFDLVLADWSRPGALLPEPAAFFAEAARLLRPDGRAVALAFADTAAGQAAAAEWMARLAEAGTRRTPAAPLVLSLAAWEAFITAAGLMPSVAVLGEVLVVATGTSAGE